MVVCLFFCLFFFLKKTSIFYSLFFFFLKKNKRPHILLLDEPTSHLDMGSIDVRTSFLILLIFFRVLCFLILFLTFQIFISSFYTHIHT